MKLKVILFLASASTFFVWACTKENVETRYPVKKIEFCDTISYSRNIKPIIDATCNNPSLPCHASGSAQDFSTYALMQPHLVNFNDRLFVKGDMPSGGAVLTPTEVSMIECWQKAGYPNN